MDINIFLKELKNYGIKNDIPNISETNACFLRDLIKIQKTKNMLEIGTANGFSTINFALTLKETGGKITTIEFSKLSFDKAIENFKISKLQKYINPILGNALDIIPGLEDKYDFIFIDGMKRRTKDFLTLIWPKVLKNGIIIIDDVIKFKHKMIGLWDYLNVNNIKYNIIPIDVDDGILMIVK